MSLVKIHMCKKKLLWQISLVWQCRFRLNSWKAWYFWKVVHSCIFFTQGMSAPFKWMHDVSLLIYLICCIFLSHYLYRAKLVGNVEERPRPGSLNNPGYSFKIFLEQGKKGWSSMASYFQVVGTLETRQGCICNKHGHVAPGCGHSVPLVDVEDVHSSTHPCSWWDRNHTWKKLHNVLLNYIRFNPETSSN